jgi:hypothetical protein
MLFNNLIVKFMKKFITLLLFCSLFVSLDSFVLMKHNPHHSASKPTDVNKKKKVKFVLRWHGLQTQTCECSGCKCSYCPCPAGICTCGGVFEDEESVDMGNDVGRADVWEDNGILYMKFDQTTADYINGSYQVPVSGDTDLSPALCAFLGFNSITIPNGFYAVDYTNSTYGTIAINAVFQ